ncbi:hypothetical protein C2E20_5281 [Micractinium conductrix]|uniref:Uncharacterized protein n=1 Tax=Micractinium conductrix TaxID=554055 RepID=A0A2P6VAY3_9CHLO|nr:hypothetical protein C2E20_5281 [Micractinium conductrix]|eukprot:PSC71228.1 hypothetical protein C2E20_5281 [Micractinium conductrix]
MSTGGWMRGVIKEVPSADTVIVAAGAGKGGLPGAEKRITLSSVAAPKLPCVFRVDYTIEAAGNREFGSVFVNEKENAALSLVAAGLAKVRTPGGQQSPFYDDLAKAAADAEAKGLGVHTKDRDAAAAAVRDLMSADEFDAAGLVARVGKGKPVDAIVEAVNSGSTLRVTILPDLQTATVMVAGVQCPSLGRRPPPSAAAPAASGEEGAAVPTTGPAPGSAAAAVAAGAAPTAAEGQPEAFSREAKYFTEQRTLHKEVKLILEGVSQFGVLVGSVQFPPPPAPKPAGDANGAAPAPETDLGAALVCAGLGRVAEWGLNMMTTGAFKLRELERGAKQGKVGMWHNYVPQAGNSAKLSDKFTGTVVEVVSGDCLVVKDKAGGVERRINLSSIRAPRVGARDRQPEPWAIEAKEFLRSRLIGKEVSVSMEYNRKVQQLLGGGEGKPELTMAFGTVTVSEGSGADQKVNNVAELLLVRGLAQVIRHRGDDERSAHYEDLMNAETQGKAGKKGQWSSKEPPKQHTNDVSLPGTSQRAKQHLPFLQRAGKLPAVCEYVLSGHRLKLHIPKEGVTIAFNPSGVRCPQRGQAAAAGRPAVPEEPYWEEALAFTREHALQRDCEVEVTSVDRVGNFQGVLRIGRMNLGAALLEAGLAKLHPSFDAYSTPGGPELEAAQNKARKAKLKVWEKDEPEAAPAEAEEEEAAGAASSGGARETMEVVVSDMTDANGMYVQIADEPRVSWVAEQLAGMSMADTPALATPLKTGDKCLAQSAADKGWYRATVEKAYTADPTAPKYDVLFMDFGNKEHVTAAAVRPMPAALAAVPGQAHQACLAFIKAPSVDDEHGVDAAQQLWQLVGGNKRLTAYVERRERLAAAGKSWGSAAPTKLHLTLVPAGTEDLKQSANAQLLATGLARLVEPKGPKSLETAEVLEALRACQEEARRKHLGMYQYGDPDSGDEDDGKRLYGVQDRPACRVLRYAAEATSAAANEASAKQCARRPAGRRHDAYILFLDNLRRNESELGLQGLRPSSPGRGVYSHKLGGSEGVANCLVWPTSAAQQGTAWYSDGEEEEEQGSRRSKHGLVLSLGGMPARPGSAPPATTATSLDMWRMVPCASVSPRFRSRASQEQRRAASPDIDAIKRAGYLVKHKQRMAAEAAKEEREAALLRAWPHGLPAAQLRAARAEGLNPPAFVHADSGAKLSRAPGCAPVSP